MRTRLKVCCMASVAEALTAARLGADAVGLVAAMPSGPGPIADDLIRAIAGSVPPGVSRFLLTSRVDPEGVVSHVEATGVDTVQLVDAVQEGTYAALRQRQPSVRIVQVLHVESERSVEDAGRLEAFVDAFLLDSGRPGAKVKELGGTGRTHDWSISAAIVARVRRPVWLAGGLNPANVADAIRAVRPFGIDLCSGVRTGGRLDEAKVAALVAAMRAADAQR